MLLALASHLAMAETSDEDLPDLRPASESETEDEFATDSEEEAYVPPRKKKKKKHTNAKRSKPSKSQRNTKRQTSGKQKPKTIVARNTTYASKQKCLDRDAIKEFLAITKCGCANKCIQKLQMLSNEGAVDAVYALRQARFECTLFAMHTPARCTILLFR